MRVVVNIPDRQITLDGFRIDFASGAFPTPENIAGHPAAGVTVITWNGAELVGMVQGGSAEIFRDPAVIRPYVEAWETALSDIVAGIDAAKKSEETSYVDFVAREKAAHTERVRLAALSDDDRAAELAAAKG